jgi:hypothetical protein
MKQIIIGLLLIALLGSSNGCMTYSSIQDSKGRQDKAVWLWSDAYTHDDKSHPGYYFLLPLTIPADIAMSPFELIFVIIMKEGT